MPVIICMSSYTKTSLKPRLTWLYIVQMYINSIIHIIIWCPVTLGWADDLFNELHHQKHVPLKCHDGKYDHCDAVCYAGFWHLEPSFLFCTLAHEGDEVFSSGHHTEVCQALFQLPTDEDNSPNTKVIRIQESNKQITLETGCYLCVLHLETFHLLAKCCN